MDDLLALPAVDVTCTLTCAGNRRKEQNMMRQTIGFNWCAPGGRAWPLPRWLTRSRLGLAGARCFMQQCTDQSLPYALALPCA